MMADLRAVSWTRILFFILFVSLVVAGAVAVFGVAALTFLATNVIAAALGVILGSVGWIRRKIFYRKRPTIGVDREYIFAGHSLPLQVIDGPATYYPGDIELLVGDELDLPLPLERALEEIRSAMTEYKGATVLFDGPCYMVAEEPHITRNWSSGSERPCIKFRVARTSYFVRVLCRGALNDEVMAYLRQRWSQDVVRPEDVRQAVMEGNSGFSPFVYPGLGINVTMVAFDRGRRPWVLLQRRGARIAENTGTWATSLHESISPEDLAGNNQLDPWRTAVRCAREELGVSLRRVDFHVAMVDEGQDVGDGTWRSGGFELVGSCEGTIEAEHLHELRYRGRDAFERESLRVVPLSVESISALLSETGIDNWFPPALASLLETLDLYVPGGWLRVSERLTSARRRLWADTTHKALAR